MFEEISFLLVYSTVGREFKKRTATISEQLNPVWNDEVYDVIIQDLWHSSVEISVFDDDKLNPDDLLGKFVFIIAFQKTKTKLKL